MSNLMAAGPGNLFAKMVRGEMPCCKIAETEHWLAFLDIYPLSKGHTLIIPKHNCERVHEVPLEYMATFGTFLSKVVKTVVPEGMAYNILQNNGSAAHQAVKYVHFHIIPKPSESEGEPGTGLGVVWPATPADKDELAKMASEFSEKYSKLSQ